VLLTGVKTAVPGGRGLANRAARRLGGFRDRRKGAARGDPSLPKRRVTISFLLHGASVRRLLLRVDSFGGTPIPTKTVSFQPRTALSALLPA